MKGDKRTVALLQEKIPRSSSLTSSEMSDNVSWVLEFPHKGLKNYKNGQFKQLPYPSAQ